MSFSRGVPPERRPGPGGASPIGDHGRQHPAIRRPVVYAQVSGTFTELHQHVKVYVGEFEASVPKSAAHDEGVRRQSQLDCAVEPGTVYLGPGSIPAGAHSPTPYIASFEVTGRKPVSGDVGDLDKRVAMTLTFDNPTGRQSQPGLLLAPLHVRDRGGPGARSPIWITINRFGGSSGDIQFAASGLPPGATAPSPQPSRRCRHPADRDGERPTPRRPTPGR